MSIAVMFLVYFIIRLAIITPLSALLLMASSKMFKTKDQRYGIAFKTSVIVYVAQVIVFFLLAFIPVYSEIIDLVLSGTQFIIVGLLAWFLVKKFYTLDNTTSLKVFGVWYAFDIILNIALSFVEGFVTASIFGLF